MEVLWLISLGETYSNAVRLAGVSDPTVDVAKATSSLLMRLILFREHFWAVCDACVAGLFEVLQAA